MLHLHSGVHLHEVEVALLVHQKLHRTGATVVDQAAQLARRAQNALSQRGVQVDGGRVLDHLLVSALHGAVALEQMHHVALAITHHLHLDVARLLHVALQEDRAVAEGGLGLVGGEREVLDQLLLVAHDTHALAATAEGGLDDHGVVHAVAELLRLFDRLDRTGRARDNGDAVLDGHLTRRGLVGHHAEVVHGGADEGNAGLLHSLREVGILGQETVAGMNRLYSMLLGDRDDGGDVEVCRHRALGRAEHVALIGLGAMQIVAVFVGVNGNSLRTHFLGSTNDTDGDLSAIGRHYLRERSHRHPSLGKRGNKS